MKTNAFKIGGPLRRGDGTELLWALLKIVIDIQPTPYRTWYTLRKITSQRGGVYAYTYKCKFTLNFANYDFANYKQTDKTWFGEIPTSGISQSESEIESIGIGGIEICIEMTGNTFRSDRNRMTNRQSIRHSESKIENRVSVISLLVRGTRIGKYNLHLMGGIYAYKCKSTISEMTNKQQT